MLHLWSLAVEEQFYLFWPLLVFFSGPRRTIAISLGLIALSPFLPSWLLDGTHPRAHPDAFSYVATITRLGPLAWGAVLASLLRLPGGMAAISQDSACSAPGCCSALIVRPRDHRHHPRLRQDPAADADLWIQRAGAALRGCARVYHHARRSEGSTGVRVLSQPWLRQIGKVSYVAYIVHLPIFVIAARTLSPLDPAAGALRVPHSPSRWPFAELALFEEAAARL